MTVTPPSRRRRAVSWGLSIVAGVLFLWLASHELRLWPDDFTIAAPALLWSAIALHVPYALVRAMRLQFVFDPIVAAASGGAQARLDRRVLYGSGLVSFFVLIVLPFKLGELSRPLLLDRGRQAGIGVTEAISGVALERLVDGLLICAMLFGGLALCEPRSVGMLADVRVVGWSMVAVFAVGLVVLLAASRDPDRAAGFVGAIVGVVHAGLADRIAGIVGRFAAAMRGVLALRRAVHFAAWSLIYWGVTVLQLWVVLHACGLELGLPEASAIVAIVGLSIQLPGGPVQAGTFQVGTGVALSLFLDPSVVEGAGSVFAAVMYLLQFVGAAVLALPGLLLLGASRRPPPPERSTV